MVNRQQQALGRLSEQIATAAVPEQPEAEEDFETWARLVQYEADLAGILSAGASGVRMDYAHLKEIRSAVSRLQTNLPELAAWKATLMDIFEQMDAIGALR